MLIFVVILNKGSTTLWLKIKLKSDKLMTKQK